VSLKVVPKAGFECTLEKNQPMTVTVMESRYINLMRLSKQFSELVSVSKEASKT
jgi:hypothetical protein